MYSAQQVCDLIGVSKSTLLRWEKEKIIPAPERSLVGNRVYGLEDVKKLLQRLSPKRARIAREVITKQIERSLIDIAGLTSLLNVLS